MMMMMMMTELNVSRFILDQWTMMMMVMILENFSVDQFGIHFRMGRITKKKNVYEWEEFFFSFSLIGESNFNFCPLMMIDTVCQFVCQSKHV